MSSLQLTAPVKDRDEQENTVWRLLEIRNNETSWASRRGSALARCAPEPVGCFPKTSGSVACRMTISSVGSTFFKLTLNGPSGSWVHVEVPLLRTDLAQQSRRCIDISYSQRRLDHTYSTEKDQEGKETGYVLNKAPGTYNRRCWRLFNLKQ